MTEQLEPKVDARDIGAAMEQRRRCLDELDTTLIDVIGQRMQVCAEIARLKRRGKIPMMQPHRLAHVRAKSIEQGRAQDLNEVFIHRLLDLIFQESCRLENVIIDN